MGEQRRNYIIAFEPRSENGEHALTILFILYTILFIPPTSRSDLLMTNWQEVLQWAKLSLNAGGISWCESCGEHDMAGDGLNETAASPVAVKGGVGLAFAGIALGHWLSRSLSLQWWSFVERCWVGLHISLVSRHTDLVCNDVKPRASTVALAKEALVARGTFKETVDTQKDMSSWWSSPLCRQKH